MNIEQMELGLGKTRVCDSISRRQRRMSRASWWFARMRQVVDSAFDWQNAPLHGPRREQIYFESAFRKPPVRRPRSRRVAEALS